MAGLTPGMRLVLGSKVYRGCTYIFSSLLGPVGCSIGVGHDEMSVVWFYYMLLSGQYLTEEYLPEVI